MSLTPFFLLDELLSGSHNRRGERSGGQSGYQSLFSNLPRPAVDVHEERDRFVIEAELPGVSKENIDVHIGDNGKSVTISGKTVARRSWKSANITEEGAQQETASTSQSKDQGTVAKKDEGAISHTISSERAFVGNTTFSRTIWLPRPADGSKVNARLQDGVLTLDIPKLSDKESVRVNIV